ncbi:hypothetical protein [Aurantimonas sp. HBX-1]|uniref:hypothetical protein n=1 Tax=Aurantimonas sp. HBX-1 TaxID=2906072 RepID=UPI001F458FE7|nr:hypothetical protein [Aurantimonas sp. HBX-1]UIJ71011.1 hypothetical protein LXB15_14935 [Aurantimonas sp. HBX-1]
MTDARKPEFKVGHPAPARRRVSAALLSLGLLGAPIGWSLQLLAGSALAGLSCVSESGVVEPQSGYDWAYPAMIGANAAAVVIGLAGLAIAFHTFRQSGHVGADTHGGVMDAGEGRTRFLSIWGIWASVLFLIATANNTLTIFWSGSCAG